MTVFIPRLTVCIPRLYFLGATSEPHTTGEKIDFTEALQQQYQAQRVRVGPVPRVTTMYYLKCSLSKIIYERCEEKEEKLTHIREKTIRKQPVKWKTCQVLQNLQSSH